MQATARRLTAEALGTLLLVAAVVGSGIMAQTLTTDTGIALLANTAATVAVLWVLITVLGPVSGAQFNPVVTLVLALRHEIAPVAALAFVGVQLAGGMAGTLIAHAMFDLPLWQVSTHVRSGVPQMLAEGVATFGLVLSILGARRAGASVAAAVALWIAAAYWFTASTSFANPAVALARAVTDTFSGIRPVDLPGFWVAQVVGALTGMALGGWLFQDSARR
ncbi:MAG: aquaporin [Rhodobacteraceae bacterium]|nr:aquaporin [Paracoccaceae bacterium]